MIAIIGGSAILMALIGSILGISKKKLKQQLKAEKAKNAEKDPAIQYNAAVKLVRDTKEPFETLKSLSPEEDDSAFVHKGDLMFNRTNTKEFVGKTTVFNLDEQMVVAGYIIRVRFKEKYSPEYISGYLNSTYGKALLRKMAKGAVHQANINAQEFQGIQVLDVPKQEQDKYVTIAKQADKSGFDELKSQFIEMFGNPVTNSKKWPTKPISEVAPEQPSETKTTGLVWLLNLDMIESNTGKVIEKVYEDDSNLLSVAPFDEGNVLYSKLRPYLNKVVIPDGKGYATTELVPLRPNQELVNLTFFSHLLRGDDFVSFANGIATGTKMPRMPLNDLRKFNCILPPIEMQKEFEEIAHQADKSGSVLLYRIAC